MRVDKATIQMIDEHQSIAMIHAYNAKSRNIERSEGRCFLLSLYVCRLCTDNVFLFGQNYKTTVHKKFTLVYLFEVYRMFADIYITLYHHMHCLIFKTTVLLCGP